MPPLPAAIIQGLAPLAPRFSKRVWGPAQVLLGGAMLAPGARPVTTALRAMGLATERHFTNDHRVLNRATWSARHGSRMLLGVLITLLVPPGATLVLGADDPVERRAGRKSAAKGCDRDAVRSSPSHVIRGFGLQWVSMMLLVPGPWSRRGWARPFLTAWCWPAETSQRRRHKTRSDWARHMMKPVRRWLPGPRLVLVVEGGFAAVALALACVKTRVGLVSPLRWEAARFHRPGPQPPGKRGPKPLKGTRQRSLQDWASRSDTPWEDSEVNWYSGQRKKLWGFSQTALWDTPGLPPVDLRVVLVCDPAGKRRMEAFCCTDLEAPPVESLPWVGMRWSVEVTCEEARAQLGVETQRQWSDKAMARTTPVLLALFSLVTVLARRLSQDGQIPVPMTAWYHQDAPTFSDCLALVRRHLWHGRYVVNSPVEVEFVPFPREAFDLLFTGLPIAA
jgi:hypothetical protein